MIYYGLVQLPFLNGKCSSTSGGKVDFIDIDQNTFNISAEKLEKKLIQAKK